MASNIYRYSLLGESLLSTLRELEENYGFAADTSKTILEKFDQVF
jgi:hypothetical protein